MIDVRGLSCPEPVIIVQKAMASGDSEYTVQSDSKTAVENITRFVLAQGYTIVSKEENGEYILTITKQ